MFGAPRGNSLLQYGKIAACPEVIFKSARLVIGAFQGGILAENVCPGKHRDGEQYQHHELDRHAGVCDQGKQRKVARSLHG
jgi:hypothetical protein